VVEEIAYRAAQIASIRSRRAVSIARGEALASRRETLARELTIMKRQEARYASAADPGVFGRQRLDALDRELLQLERGIAEVDGEREVQDASIEQSRREEAELVASYRREAALRLAEQEEQRLQVAQTLKRIEARIQETVLRSPAAGRVGRIAVHGAGEIIAPGEVIMEVVPSDARLYAEVEVPADRIGKIAVGHDASLKILTFDYTQFGTIAAVVARVSPTSRRNETGEMVFDLRLDARDVTWRQTIPQGTVGVSPGLTVTADIRLGRRTILSYLLRPARVIGDRAFTET
jgi:adhesin transport system membrane fusion protein